MNTLLEFITFTKGVEYLIAIAFLFAFIAFWQLVQHRGKGLVVRVVPLLILSLALGFLTSTCNLPETQTAMVELNGRAALLSSPVLVEMYGPASFDHEGHQDMIGDCTTCHHHSGNKTPPCKECHENPFAPDNLNKPGIARAYHLRCVSCHMENQVGPTECTGCHNKATIPPLSVTHPLVGKENCFSCHGDEIPGVPRLPADHNNGVTNGECNLCHQPSVAVAALATELLPHEVSGHEDCLMCHGQGIGEAAKVPTDHVGRTNESCLLCHKIKKD